VVQVETVHAILFHVQVRPREERAALCEELVRMLVCALEPFDRMRPGDSAAATPPAVVLDGEPAGASRRRRGTRRDAVRGAD
jgi:hypothetical protein